MGAFGNLGIGAGLVTQVALDKAAIDTVTGGYKKLRNKKRRMATA
jgi:hypothetical protein